MTVNALSSWRYLLGKIISDAQEKQRIAHELGVSPVTLSRWVSGISDPRPQNLRRLLNVLPLHRHVLLASIMQEFPNFVLLLSERMQDEQADAIPPAFYARALSAYTMVPGMQRSWSLTRLILQQALEQLDPDQVGMAVTLVQCMPPHKNGKIHSLREQVGYGTPPWHLYLEPFAIFLGSESLAGYAVSSCQPCIFQNRKESYGLLPSHWSEWEKSAAAYPILRAGSVAGCLLVSCAVPEYFFPFRRKLIQDYADLLALVFDRAQYYERTAIQLAAMPGYHTQKRYLADFRQQVSHVLTQRTIKGYPVNLTEAEQQIWEQVEEQLMALSANGQPWPHELQRSASRGRD